MIEQPKDEQRGVPAWRREFPYRHDADDLVARREFLRVAILSSGALFAGTVLLAVLDALEPQTKPAPLTVARVSELQPNEVRYFAFPTSDDQAVLINRVDVGPVAFSQKCTHLSCAVRYERAPTERLYCPCHDGVFSAVTGDVLAGPPQRPLPRIILERHGDELVAVGVEP